MQSFRVDFTMNQEHEMTIDREGGIFRSELDEIELRMLQHERIPNFLSMDWFEMDGKVSFRYKLSGMRMLLHRLQQQPLSMEQYYTLILGVTDALYECKHYMLRPEGCLLDEQYIFIGDDLHQIRLAYVPMKGSSSEQALGSGDLLSLIVRFTSYVEQIDGDGLKRVLHHLTAKRWPLAELRTTLLELIGENRTKQTIVTKQTAWQPEQQPGIIAGQPQLYKEEQPAIPPNLPPETNISFEKKADPYRPLNSDFADYANILLDDEEGEAQTDTKKKWIIAAGILIAIACVWRFVYLPVGTRQSLLISSGITLLCLALLLLIWRKRGNEDSNLQDTDFAHAQHESGYGTFSGTSMRGAADAWGASEEKKENGVSLNQNSLSLKQNPLSLKQGPVSAQAPLHVVAANVAAPKGEPTIFLGRDSQSTEQKSDPEIWLQRSWEGQHTKLELNEGFFRIGRMGEQLNYEELAGGVSRLHLEIVRVKEDYKAKDLGSRNGSLLNGQTMIPYKSYKLAIGDIIHLAGEAGPSYELKRDEGIIKLTAAH
ncbi:DUF6382 domain-containing protein [Paenibacillus luteus]|uniref:DUF6382 domain-containing protein n=1 Tax=Paenibacillus luteus TaxID=2545753 RepID=UPI001143A428|nr:DUF6382 domain-containing protein [Paenibacillus luteus]